MPPTDPRDPTPPPDESGLIPARGCAPHATDHERLALSAGWIAAASGVAMLAAAGHGATWLLLPAAILPASALALILWATRQGRTAIDAADRRLCPDCRYDLRAGPARGQCPECGRPYAADELERLWTLCYGERTNRPAVPPRAPIRIAPPAP